MKEPSPFDIPLPEPEVIPVDLTKHLVAPEVVIEVDMTEAQTDEFIPEPPPKKYVPQKTGIDVETQVEDGEIFDFDAEVDPILDVLINKTLEQSLMEAQEEFELERLAEYKKLWLQRQSVAMAEWQQCVEEEHQRWEEKEKLMDVKRAEKERQARLLLKLQAVDLAQQHLARLVPNAFNELKEVAFPDKDGLIVDRFFLPQLLGLASQEVAKVRQADEEAQKAAAEKVRLQRAKEAAILEAARIKEMELERKKAEERQIRKGRIRIMVETGAGEKVAVGPVQISSQESIDEVQERVFTWLQDNRPDLAESWPHGVLLCIDREPVQATIQLFEAKAGQISMTPKPEPPALTPEEDPPADGDGEPPADPAA